MSNFASARSYMEEKSRREKLSKKKLKVIRQKAQGEQEVYAQTKGIVAKTCLKLFMRYNSEREWMCRARRVK